MQSSSNLLQTYLAKLGFSPEIARIYLALYTYGPQNISQLARHSGVERTHIYRMIEELRRSRLVEVEVAYKRNVFVAAPIHNLHILIAERENELKDLQSGLENLSQEFSATTLTSPLTKVQFYHGLEGNMQTLWNQTRAKGETCAILHENIQSKTNATYFQRWVHLCNQRGLRFRGVVSNHYLATQKKWYATHHHEQLEHWQSRYVPPKIFPIAHSTVVYDDVVCHYHWQNEETFSIEIHNPEIAQAQRQYFNLLWQQASPLLTELEDPTP